MKLPEFVDGLAIYLLIILIVIGVADFALGPEGKKGLRDKLEEFWLRLSYVKWVDAGRAEATFCLNLLERAFGKDAFSFRRFVGCGLFLCLIYSIVYVASETLRWGLLPFRWPSTGAHYITNPGINYPFLWISIGLTHWLCAFSTRRFEKNRYATWLFLLMMLGTLIVSFCLTIIMEYVVKSAVLANGICLFRVYFGFDPECTGAGSPQSFGDRLHMFLLPFPTAVAEATSGLLFYLQNPIYSLAPLWNALVALAFDYEKEINAYSVAVSYSVVILRILVTGLFFVGWSVARSGHKVLSFLVYRLSQSEKGVLTVVAAAIALLVKLLDELHKKS